MIYEETCNKKICIDNNLSNSIHKMKDVEMIDSDNFHKKSIMCINCGRKIHLKEQCESIIIPKYMPCQ